MCHRLRPLTALLALTLVACTPKGGLLTSASLGDGATAPATGASPVVGGSTQPTTPGAAPTTPGAAPTTPGAAPSTPGAAPAAPAAAPAPGAVSFKAQIAPVITRSCAGCHAPGESGVRDVALFDDAGNVRFDQVRDEIAGIVRTVKRGSMPRGGKPKLSAEELAQLEQWRAAGTPDN